jgi:esterase/lipase
LNIEYELDIPKHLKKLAPKNWYDFVDDAFRDLAEVKEQEEGVFNGNI